MSDSLVLNSLAHKATGISVTWSFQAECEKQCTSEKTGIMCFPSLNVINNLVAVVWKSCSLPLMFLEEYLLDYITAVVEPATDECLNTFFRIIASQKNSRLSKMNDGCSQSVL